MPNPRHNHMLVPVMCCWSLLHMRVKNGASVDGVHDSGLPWIQNTKISGMHILQCQREVGNVCDTFAVAIMKGDTIVGYCPWKLAALCFLSGMVAGSCVRWVVEGQIYLEECLVVKISNKQSTRCREHQWHRTHFSWYKFLPTLENEPEADSASSQDWKWKAQGNWVARNLKEWK